MITAKNYASQAHRSLSVSSDLLSKQGYKRDYEIVKKLLADIIDSVKFALPDEGSILDDQAKGIHDKQIRLPFKKITVEYFIGNYTGSGVNAHAPKRLIIAEELTRNELMTFYPDIDPDTEDEIFIKVCSAFALEGNSKEWHFDSYGWILPSFWNGGSTRKQMRFKGWPFCVMPDTIDILIQDKQLNPDVIISELLHNDSSQEVTALLELCEALSCSNVTHIPIKKIDQRKNKQRIKSGKLPIYETRILVIESDKLGHHTQSLGSGDNLRSGPRQHLRRGHIRRLPDNRNTWVNSCVVGSADKGVIQKQYQVT